MEKIVAFEKKKRKQTSQKKVGYIVAIILLSIALIGTNLMSFLGAWKNLLQFVQPINVLGKQSTIQATLNGANAMSFEFKGSSVMDTYYNHLTFVNMPITEKRFVLRARASVNTGQISYNAKIASDSNWIEGEQGYFYLTTYALGGQTIGLSNGIIMPKIETKQDKTYSLVITIESLQEDFDFKQIWQTPENFQILQTVQD